MDDSQLERLIAQCKANDIDVRIDALTKLQAEFESGVEILDPDALITALKTCLRTNNMHLMAATLSALPPALPLLITRSSAGFGASTSTSPAASTSSVTSSVIDASLLRQLLVALLPAGGVIERLGDSRDRARDKARETLVTLGGYAYRSSGAGSALRAKEGKGPETPLMIFERFLRENGMGSKQFRVREQSILTLVQIRRDHHAFPIRSFLPSFVGLLEDSDSTVRDCAKQSVVELFTGPAVTDAARADLKKEMAKKGVRKGTVDSVLSRIAAAGTISPLAMSEAGSENGDGAVGLGSSAASALKKSALRTQSQSNIREPSRPASRSAAISPMPMEDVTPSAASDVKTVYIASSRDLENEFAAMLRPFEGKETEHNWSAREQAVTRVRGMLRGEVHERFTETFLHCLKPFIDASLKALTSLRTTVSSNTCSLYTELATTLGSAIDPLVEPLYVNLLRMASLTKKIISQQSQATVTTLMQNGSAQPRIVLPLLWNTLQDKAIQTRVYVMGHVKNYLDAHGMRARSAIETGGGVETLEKCIKKGLNDANPGVRDVSRQAFWAFEGVWRERGRVIMDALDASARKQLEKACPNPASLAGLATAAQTPQVKKSSVAAAIAASRAKAKAIATAPPSLRHQATSTARVVSSPPSKRPASPSLSTSSSGGVRPTSPLSKLASSGSSPRARVMSGGTLPRSVSSSFVPNREQSRQPVPGTPPSPTPEQSTFRRRISSPLASPTGNSVLRRAIQTALPASPPPSSSSLLLQPAPTLQLPPLRGGVRESINISGFHSTNDDSLLLASNIPIPEDSDSDMDVDTSVNLISFSTPYERYPPAVTTPQAKSAGSFSPRSSSSRPPLSNALSTGTSSPPSGLSQPIVEDALRARAEQAESAAERLLELVDPEEESPQSSTIPASLLLRNTGPEATPKGRFKEVTRSSPSSSKTSPVSTAPQTPPVNKRAAIMRKAALFQDSPAPKQKTATSLFDIISGTTSESAWSNKRKFLLNERSSLEAGEPSDRKEELNGYILALEHGTADIRVLKKLAFLCQESPVNEPISPISPDLAGPFSPFAQFGNSRSLLSLKSDLWDQDKSFERLFGALMQYLEPTRDAGDLEYALIVLWELLEHQAPLLEGREAEVFSALLRVRYSANTSVMQATTQLRDLLTSRIEPVYGLTTMHASIRAFRVFALPSTADSDIKNGTYAFGLIALGKFILRLPAEVLEDELPRLRSTLISALTDQSSESSLNVREAAAASIIAAQLVLRDESRLFTLLDGLPEDKMNLLTYFFDKHGCRGSLGEEAQSGMDKLEKEMRRLDGRTSTPLRPSGAPVVA